MVNPDLVGQTFPGQELITIKGEEIAAFSRALGEINTESAAPTFAIRISLDQSQRLLQASGLDWSRVVHGDQRFEIKRALIAGDVVRTDATIESLKVLARNEIVTVRSDLFVGDELVVITWSTLVARA
jgi:hypothetical protein